MLEPNFEQSESCLQRLSSCRRGSARLRGDFKLFYQTSQTSHQVLDVLLNQWIACAVRQVEVTVFPMQKEVFTAFSSKLLRLLLTVQTREVECCFLVRLGEEVPRLSIFRVNLSCFEAIIHNLFIP